MCYVEQLWEAWGEESDDFSVADSNMEESVEETNLDVCTAQIGHRFDCLAATLEMPVRLQCRRFLALGSQAGLWLVGTASSRR